LALKNQARLYRTVEVDALPPDDVKAGLRILCEKRDELNGAAPQVPRRAFKRARKGIEEGEAKHAIDEQK
jgi:hypothetical protein